MHLFKEVLAGVVLFEQQGGTEYIHIEEQT